MTVSSRPPPLSAKQWPLPHASPTPVPWHPCGPTRQGPPPCSPSSGTWRRRVSCAGKEGPLGAPFGRCTHTTSTPWPTHCSASLTSSTSKSQSLGFRSRSVHSAPPAHHRTPPPPAQHTAQGRPVPRTPQCWRKGGARMRTPATRPCGSPQGRRSVPRLGPSRLHPRTRASCLPSTRSWGTGSGPKTGPSSFGSSGGAWTSRRRRGRASPA
mmetsp:Transcript_130415/g.225474  ORF Transcript_130415/g.225474 Transcript_130415/m.225474 type:complete len:211 (+) Transcript_130415:1842-2474(+)